MTYNEAVLRVFDPVVGGWMNEQDVWNMIHLFLADRGGDVETLIADMQEGERQGFPLEDQIVAAQAAWFF